MPKIAKNPFVEQTNKKGEKFFAVELERKGQPLLKFGYYDVVKKATFADKSLDGYFAFILEDKGHEGYPWRAVRVESRKRLNSAINLAYRWYCLEKGIEYKPCVAGK